MVVALNGQQYLILVDCTVSLKRQSHSLIGQQHRLSHIRWLVNSTKLPMSHIHWLVKGTLTEDIFSTFTHSCKEAGSACSLSAGTECSLSTGTECSLSAGTACARAPGKACSLAAGNAGSLSVTFFSCSLRLLFSSLYDKRNSLKSLSWTITIIFKNTEICELHK